MGLSKGGLSTKIHATYDALGNPTGFNLTAGQCHDLDGSDVLLEELDDEVEALLADKAYDDGEPVTKQLEAKMCMPVIPSKSNRKVSYDYDKHLYRICQEKCVN